MIFLRTRRSIMFLRSCLRGRKSDFNCVGNDTEKGPFCQRAADGRFFPRAYARGGPERFPIDRSASCLQSRGLFRAGTVHLSEASLGCIQRSYVVERHQQFRAQYNRGHFSPGGSISSTSGACLSSLYLSLTQTQNILRYLSSCLCPVRSNELRTYRIESWI